MDAQVAFAERHRSLLLAATTAWTAAGVVLYLWLPLIAPAVLLLSIVAPLAWRLMIGRGFAIRPPSAVTVALALAGVYLLINASWSLSPSTARFALLMLFLCIAAVHFTVQALEGGDAEAGRAMATGLYVAMVVVGAVVCLEAFSGQWLRQQLMTVVPVLRPDPKHLVIEDGRVTFMQPYLLNRNIAALTLLFWPTVLAMGPLAAGRREQRWLLAGLVPVGAAILGGDHATSKIAFIGAAAAFAGCQVSLKIARRAIAWGWVAAVVLVVPLATLAFHNSLYLATWMPRTAKHRIVIWGHTSQLIAKAPILGSGIHTARALNDPHGHDAPLAPGSEFRLTTGLHSHNGYLQTWYEAGAVGAVFLLCIGLLLLRTLAQAPVGAQPCLYATFAACALMGVSSFSLWQPWFMAALGLAVVSAMLGWTLAERAASKPAPQS
jgi:O-antigen ligase